MTIIESTQEEIEEAERFHICAWTRIRWYSRLYSGQQIALFKRYLACKGIIIMKEWCREMNGYKDFDECMNELSNLL